MNPDAIDRNTKASENGRFCEEYALRNVPGLVWIGGTYDAEWNGVPVDVKGCEAYYRRYDYPNQKRKAGRVTIEQSQKEELEEKNGLIFCVVHFGELVTNSFFVPAVKVPDCRQIAWTTLQRIAGAC